MYKITLLLFLIAVANSCFSQKFHNNEFDSTIFNKQSRKTQDTIVFEAIFHSIGKISQSNTLECISKGKFIDINDYNTAISFTPTSYKKSMYLPYKDVDPSIYAKLINVENKNTRILITGRVIHKFKKVDGELFFLIDKIEFP